MIGRCTPSRRNHQSRKTPAISPRATSPSAIEYRDLDPEGLIATYRDDPAQLAELLERSPEEASATRACPCTSCGAEDGHEYIRFDVFLSDPHYHYNHRGAEIVNNVIEFDVAAHGDMLPWALGCIRSRLAPCSPKPAAVTWSTASTRRHRSGTGTDRAARRAGPGRGPGPERRGVRGGLRTGSRPGRRTSARLGPLDGVRPFRHRKVFDLTRDHPAERSNEVAHPVAVGHQREAMERPKVATGELQSSHNAPPDSPPKSSMTTTTLTLPAAAAALDGGYKYVPVVLGLELA